MDTTVTGMFKTPQLASRAAACLLEAGFRSDQVRVIHNRTPDRHWFLDDRTSDAKRAVILGIAFGVIGGAVAGASLAGVLGLVQAAVVGALAVGAGGALLGLAIGRSTKSQVRDELEHQVDAGTILVSVTTDAAHSPSALHVLAQEGGSSMVATAASFTAAVLPTPQG